MKVEIKAGHSVDWLFSRFESVDSRTFDGATRSRAIVTKAIYGCGRWMSVMERTSAPFVEPILGDLVQNR